MRRPRLPRLRGHKPAGRDQGPASAGGPGDAPGPTPVPIPDLEEAPVSRRPVYIDHPRDGAWDPIALPAHDPAESGLAREGWEPSQWPPQEGKAEAEAERLAALEQLRAEQSPSEYADRREPERERRPRPSRVTVDVPEAVRRQRGPEPDPAPERAAALPDGRAVRAAAKRLREAGVGASVRLDGATGRLGLYVDPEDAERAEQIVRSDPDTRRNR